MFILHLLQYMLLNRASPKNVDSASAKKNASPIPQSSEICISIYQIEKKSLMAFVLACQKYFLTLKADQHATILFVLLYVTYIYLGRLGRDRMVV